MIPKLKCRRVINPKTLEINYIEIDYVKIKSDCVIANLKKINFSAIKDDCVAIDVDSIYIGEGSEYIKIKIL